MESTSVPQSACERFKTKGSLKQRLTGNFGIFTENIISLPSVSNQIYKARNITRVDEFDVVLTDAFRTSDVSPWEINVEA